MAKNNRVNDDNDFQDVSWDIEGWFKPDNGLVLRGKLVDFKTIETEYGANLVYIFETTATCTARPSGDDDSEGEEFPVGSTIAVFESGGLKSLRDIRVGTEVILTVTGQKKVKRGTMWQYRVQASKHRGNGPLPELIPPRREPRARNNRSSRDDVGDDFNDITKDPF